MTTRIAFSDCGFVAGKPRTTRQKNNDRLKRVIGYIKHMVSICPCGNTIKRPQHYGSYCSDFCNSFNADETTSWWNTGGKKQTMFCIGCGSNFELVFGNRSQVFCSSECNRSIQQKSKWIMFNICRILARHPDGLTAGEIARLLDEFDFNQNQRSAGFHARKLCRIGTLENISSETPAKYRLFNPDAHAGVWLA
ncbi:hypothetical protein N9M03_00155 [bacterium]|nr:hypothetical protein [bacterium]